MISKAERAGYFAALARICCQHEIHDPRERELLRHRITEVALGRRKSSRDFTRPDMDRIFAIIRRIERDGPTIVTTAAQADEAEYDGDRRRLIWCLDQRVATGYVESISEDMYLTRAWRDLPTCDLLNLLRTVENRCRSNPRLSPHTPSRVSPNLCEK